MGVVFSMCDIVYQYCWCIDGLVLSGKCGDNESLHVHSTDKRSVECDSSRSEVWCGTMCPMPPSWAVHAPMPWLPMTYSESSYNYVD